MNSKSLIAYIMVACCGLLFAACRVHDRLCWREAQGCVPSAYYQDGEGRNVDSCWWKEYQEPALDEMVDRALENNLDIRQAWCRLCQARAAAVKAGADKVPAVNMTNRVTETKVVKGRAFSATAGAPALLLQGAVDYEVDLWRRIDSTVEAAWNEYCATAYDVEDTQLLIAATVTDLWFRIQEQYALLDILYQQVEVNRTQLELLELRFSVGQSSVLDVYQQRLQLSQTLSEIPPVKRDLATNLHQLDLLMAVPAGCCVVSQAPIMEMGLPPFPVLGSPCELLYVRSDLNAAWLRLQQADAEVAAAIADRFPKLTVPITYDFTASSWGSLFENEVLNIVGQLVTPLIDGGERAAEVAFRKGVVCERLDAFRESFLTALVEVEDAIAKERFQIELLDLLREQVEIAKRNLVEARLRYANGLNDYLTVIVAIQALQRLERRMVTEQRTLLTIRAELYRALGGWGPERNRNETI